MRRFVGSGGLIRSVCTCGVLAAVTLVVAACGSSSSSSSSSSSASSGASSSSTSQASLGPIKIGNVSDITGPVPLPYSLQGIKAYFKAVNAAGGIDGRQVQIIGYDDQLNPVRAAQGARTLVNDGVVALAGDLSLTSCTVNQHYFVQADVRDVYGGASELACFHTPNISAVNVGPLGDWLITEQFVAKTFPSDLANVCALETNTGTANPYHIVANNYAKVAFGHPFKYINNTIDANSDINALMVTAKQQDCRVIMSDTQPTQTAAFVNDAKTQGFSPHFVFQGAQYSPQLAVALPHTAPGELYSIAEVQPFTQPSPGITQMTKDFAAAGVGINGLSEFGWLAGKVLNNILDTIQGPITRASVNAALLKATSVSTDGMTAVPYSFGTAAKHESNQSGKIVELANGKWLTVTGWLTIPAGVIPS